MEKSIEEILDICLKRIAQGIPADEVLKEYPDYRDELKELLAVTKDIEGSPLPRPSDSAISSCLIKIGEALLQKKRVRKTKLPRLLYLPSAAWARALAFALILIFISWGVVNLSADSIPGNILYPIKLKLEKVKFFLTVNPKDKIELRLIFSEERMQELIKHLDKKGELSTQLLKAMLDEASLALENVSKLPEEERMVYFSKLEHLNAYQKDVLEELRPKVKTLQKEELDNAIKMCGNRMEWMDKMRRKEVPPGKWGPCCGWK